MNSTKILYLLLLIFGLETYAQCPDFNGIINNEVIQFEDFNNIQIDDNGLDLNELYGLSLFVNRNYVGTLHELPFTFEKDQFYKFLNCGYNTLTITNWKQEGLGHDCYREVSVNLQCSTNDNVYEPCITFRDSAFNNDFVSNGDVVFQNDIFDIQAFFPSVETSEISSASLYYQGNEIQTDLTNPFRFEEISLTTCKDVVFTVVAYNDIGVELCTESIKLHVLCFDCSDVKYSIHTYVNDGPSNVYLDELNNISQNSLNAEITDDISIKIRPGFAFVDVISPNGVEDEVLQGNNSQINTGAETIHLELSNYEQEGTYQFNTQIGREECFSSQTVELDLLNQNLNCNAVTVPSSLPLEAELACTSENVYLNETEGYAETNHQSSLSFNITIETAANYKFRYRYSRAVEQGGWIIIHQDNNSLIHRNLASTTTWNEYYEDEIYLDLYEGTSKLNFTFMNHEAPNEPVMFLDWFEITCADEGNACDDGLIHTINDTVNDNCNCVGTDTRFRAYVKGASSGYKNIYTFCLDCKMHKDLILYDLVPNAQPFNTAPFYYFGTEYLQDFPETMVDWVLLVARDNNGNPEDKVAAIMHEDATITDLDGNEAIVFPQLNAQDSYRISLHPRGHLGVISNQTIANETLIDFTLPNTTEGNDQTLVFDGTNYLYAGDFNNNGVINSIDFNEWSGGESAVNIYQPYDADGNGVINNLDFNAWAGNKAKLGADKLLETGY